ncbi:hypothetical protein EVG20_g6646 [Dentipellis fragilis]|uniref:Uncharacterized protein n=1 Tax=Dentipellis fragilis TaxID=205917 RepID=A0A4Y9YKG8_9AGAM|nr:hypothetical protein EVG20_g6646 [Dentipellis fragilis]
MSAHPLPQTYHYIRFTLSPPCSSPLIVRRAIQEALSQAFGATASNTYVDILYVADNGEVAVVRTSPRCVTLPVSIFYLQNKSLSVMDVRSEASRVMAALAVSTAEPRLSALTESPFLPSLSAQNAIVF